MIEDLARHLVSLERRVHRLELIQAGPKNNFTATSNPTVNDDNTAGYSIGSLWINTSATYLYVCMDASTGAASWYYVAAGV